MEARDYAKYLVYEDEYSEDKTGLLLFSFDSKGRLLAARTAKESIDGYLDGIRRVSALVSIEDKGGRPSWTKKKEAIRHCLTSGAAYVGSISAMHSILSRLLSLYARPGISGFNGNEDIMGLLKTDEAKNLYDSTDIEFIKFFTYYRNKIIHLPSSNVAINSTPGVKKDLFGLMDRIEDIIIMTATSMFGEGGIVEAMNSASAGKSSLGISCRRMLRDV